MSSWVPGTRRPGIDVARIAALGVVVLGHLSLAVIDRGPDGDLRGANLLALRPGWAWVAVLSPMPVFFAAAGWANSTSDLRSSASRVRSLVGLGAVVVVTWVVVAGIAWWLTGTSGVVTDGARIATQPLWFLAAYVPLCAAAPRVLRAARRPVAAVAVCVGVLVVLDLARFVADAPRWIGWPGFAAAWGLAWLLGVWWRSGREDGTLHERRVGVLMAVGGTAAAIVLVRTAGYSPALIDAVPGARSNTTPPTLYTAAAVVAQVGVLMVVAGALDRVGARWSRVWARLGEMAVGVYVLHLTALSLCAAALAAGIPTPQRLTALWWVTRPLWFAAVLCVTLLLALVVDRVRARRRHRSDVVVRPSGSAWRWWGAVAATVGGAVVGLWGPRTPVAAVVCATAFVVAWWCLGATDAPEAQCPS